MIHIKLTIMSFLLAGGFIAGKVVVQQAGPFTISFARFLVATTVLTVLLCKEAKQIKIDWSLLGYALGAAFFGIFAYNYLFFSGIKLVDAGRGSVIISTVPIVVVLLSYMIFKEKLRLVKALGILISVIGAWVVITKGQKGMIIQGSIGLGEFYLILSVFCAASFTLIAKRILNSLSPLATMVYVSSIGTAFLLVPALLELRQSPIQIESYAFFINMLYLAIGPSVIAGMLYYEAIGTVGPARASQYMNLIPVFTVVFGIIFLGETLSLSLIVGGGCVTTGLYLTNLS